MTAADLSPLFTTGYAEITDPDLGPVQIRVNQRAHRFLARWTRGCVHFTVPPGVTTADISNAWDKLRPRLAKCRPTASFYPGMTIELSGLSIEFGTQERFPDEIMISAGLPKSRLLLGTAVDPEDPGTATFIDRALKRIAAKVAPQLLLPRAREIAEQCGVAPANWKITYGTKTLGFCTPRKEISLSSAIVFLTPELRDYIVCHELAHLTEMNHSSRFHALCNRYCALALTTSGLAGVPREGTIEQHLIHRLHRHPWPILR